MASVTTGTRLGPYEIVSRIGAGGMGWESRMYSVPLRVEGDTLRPGEPEELFAVSPEVRFFHVSPTDDRILIGRAVNPENNVEAIHYVSGWN